MNVVNFSDGIDGLAAGVCAISAAPFAVIAFDLGKDAAGVLAAITAGAALGFLVHNFHPASVFMGDCGSNLLGLLLGGVDRRGLAQDERPDRADRAARRARRAVPRHRLRRRQADQVPPPGLPGRLQPLPPPLPPHRLLAAADRALPLRLDGDDGGARGRAALRARTPTRGDLNVGWSLVHGRLLPRSRSPRASTSCSCSRSSSCAGCAPGSCATPTPDTTEHEIDARGRARARDGRVPARSSRSIDAPSAAWHHAAHGPPARPHHAGRRRHARRRRRSSRRSG